jgi:hypothetical protein
VKIFVQFCPGSRLDRQGPFVSVVGVDDIWAPVESTEDFSSGVMPLQCESRMSGPSKPYFVRGPIASKAGLPIIPVTLHNSGNRLFYAIPPNTDTGIAIPM